MWSSLLINFNNCENVYFPAYDATLGKLVSTWKQITRHKWCLSYELDYRLRYGAIEQNNLPTLLMLFSLTLPFTLIISVGDSVSGLGGQAVDISISSVVCHSKLPLLRLKTASLTSSGRPWGLGRDNGDILWLPLT